MQWFAQAPSNIALIKYMGKKDSSKNIPINASLSYTLDKLQSSVSLESIPGNQDKWEPLEIPGLPAIELPEKAQQRFLAHMRALKEGVGYKGGFIVRSTNNFPMGSGLASSASSFAALTKACTRALSELTKQEEPDLETIARLSQHGSGSSCRSFFSPWCLWDETTIKTINTPYQTLHHQAVIISHDEKHISSSDAHEAVKTSASYAQRSTRASQHLKALLEAFDEKNWRQAYEVCNTEFKDMHQMFETASTPFSYMTEESRAILKLIDDRWELKGDGPIVTMDAGPNIHLLYRDDQREFAEQIKHDHLLGNFDVL